MDCASCERKVETALKRLRSIEHVSASVLAGSVQLTVCSGEVASTIKALGYQVIVSGALRALAWGITGMWVARNG